MNTLEEFIFQNNLNPVDTMNRLIDANLISDNAIWPADVAEPDSSNAVKYLKEHLWIKHP